MFHRGAFCPALHQHKKAGLEECQWQHFSQTERRNRGRQQSQLPAQKSLYFTLSKKTNNQLYNFHLNRKKENLKSGEHLNCRDEPAKRYDCRFDAIEHVDLNFNQTFFRGFRIVIRQLRQE